MVIKLTMAAGCRVGTAYCVVAPDTACGSHIIDIMAIQSQQSQILLDFHVSAVVFALKKTLPRPSNPCTGIYLSVVKPKRQIKAQFVPQQAALESSKTHTRQSSFISIGVYVFGKLF